MMLAAIKRVSPIAIQYDRPQKHTLIMYVDGRNQTEEHAVYFALSAHSTMTRTKTVVARMWIVTTGMQR